VINGQRVFSDAQCGAHASVRQLSELNVMDRPPARAAPQPYSRDPGPAPAYPPSPPPTDAGMMDEPEPEGSYPIYTAPSVVVVRERGRRNHPHRVHHPQPRAARP
jgi:hypothetical protein